MGHHAVLVVKTNHLRFPNKWLDEEMKTMPGGCWLTMQGQCRRTGVELVAIGYKYNSKKVLHFVTTLGAGSTVRGEPYRMKFNDAYGNVCHRNVARPAVLSRYFKYSNRVDVNNQMRQHNLALEECWVTTNSWFRIWTTFVGWTVTDVWFLRRKVKDVGDPGEQEKRQIVKFAGDLSESLLEMAGDMEAAEEAMEEAQTNAGAVVTVESSDSTLSSLTGHTNDHKHTKEFLTYKGSKSATRSGRKVASQARCLWCSRTEGKQCKTQVRCVQCGVGFCDAKSGRKCWANHVLNDGPPPKQPQQRNKRSCVCQVVTGDVSDDE